MQIKVLQLLFGFLNGLSGLVLQILNFAPLDVLHFLLGNLIIPFILNWGEEILPSLKQEVEKDEMRHCSEGHRKRDPIHVDKVDSIAQSEQRAEVGQKNLSRREEGLVVSRDLLWTNHVLEQLLCPHVGEGHWGLGVVQRVAIDILTWVLFGLLGKVLQALFPETFALLDLLGKSLEFLLQTKKPFVGHSIEDFIGF